MLKCDVKTGPSRPPNFAVHHVAPQSNIFRLLSVLLDDVFDALPHGSRVHNTDIVPVTTLEDYND